MSRYELDKALWETIRSPDLAAELADDPERFLADRDLSSGEQDALRNADTRALYEAGAIPFLVYQFSMHRAGGFSLDFAKSYVGSLAGATSQDLIT